jgi:hypothetical protein
VEEETGDELHPNPDQLIQTFPLNEAYGKWPALLVESTTYTDSVWTAEAAAAGEHADTAFMHQLAPVKWNDWLRKLPVEGASSLVEFLRQGNDDPATKDNNARRFARTVKPLAPVASIYTRNMYRRVFAMMTPFAELYSYDPAKDKLRVNLVRYEYFVLTQRMRESPDKFHYGALASDLLLPPPLPVPAAGGDTPAFVASPMCHSVLRIKPSAVGTAEANFEYMLSDIPLARFPRPPSVRNIPAAFKKDTGANASVLFTDVQELARLDPTKERITYLAPSYDFLTDKDFNEKMMQVLQIYWARERNYESVKALDVRVAHSVTLRVIVTQRRAAAAASAAAAAQ